VVADNNELVVVGNIEPLVVDNIERVVADNNAPLVVGNSTHGDAHDAPNHDHGVQNHHQRKRVGKTK